ncbi:MAG: DUF190 domain-containing protein [Prolixibacteraceae bacterium]|nr:DUF190 domain-containing protein [Prolixibacteraceae bacterium]MBN2774148.1 DUF190 domain-containing protein [Prolixibacteraceae bacterium]
MNIEGKASLMKIYIGESDRYNGRPLYEEIVFEARKEGLAGATVTKGVMSFGASHSIHTMKIFAISSDLPVTIEIVDSEKKVQKFAAVVDKLIDGSKKGGLVTISPINVRKYVRGEKYNAFNSF